MKLKALYTTIPLVSAAALLVSCGEQKEKASHADKDKHGHSHGEHGHDHDSDEHHAHEDSDKGHAHGDAHDGDAHHDHEHGEEVSLGTFKVGGMTVEAAQAHGNVAAGKEGHLIIKLPYTDKGDTVVRAWIGTSDRTLSSVGKGVYAPSHDDYDIHTVAPSPLPEGAKWWLEVEKPDDTTAVGSVSLLKNLKK